MTQRTKFKLFIYAILFLIGLALVGYAWMHYAAQGRDYRRLGDMKLIQEQLTAYNIRYNTYQIPGCQLPSVVSECRGDSDRPIHLEGIADPLGTGSYKYSFTDLSENDFSISFSLETSIRGLTPGQHYYTASGIFK